MRLLWADVLTKTLKAIVSSPEDDRRWRIFFGLPKMCLRLPRRGGKKKQRIFEVAPLLLERLQRAKNGEWATLWEEAQRDCRGKKGKVERMSSRENIRERVTSLVEDGQLARAVEALDSNGMHKLDTNVVEILRRKHPVGPRLPDSEEDVAPSAQFDAEEVKKAISSFRMGTAPGGSKFRVSYLKDALTTPAADTDRRLSESLTEVVNLLASGEAPEESACWITGAPLYPLRKKDGGVRPVAVGEVMRRLVAKCFCARFKASSEELFVEAGQVGVGTRGGAEAAVIAVRTALQKGGGRLWTLKVDLENAYNSVDRGSILRAVKRYFPEMEAWYRFCYQSPAKLFCEGEVLPFESSQGVQQGDPLGPLLFALGILHACKKLKAELQADTLSVWYLDDGTIVGEADEVVRAWELIQTEVNRVGLKVNKDKCELIAPEGFEGELPEGLRGIPVVKGNGFELLGAPIGDKAFCENYIQTRVAKIAAALKNLEIIDDPQIEMLLVRFCLGFPRFVFCLRSAPPEDTTEAVRNFDTMISGVLQDRLGILLTAEQEQQARLPVTMGGLGVERAEDIVECAYLGNILATRELVGKLLGGGKLVLEELQGAKAALEAWNVKVEKHFENVEDLLKLREMQTKQGELHPQRVLSGLVHRRLHTELLANTHDLRDELRLRAVGREDAGAWWNVIPVKQLGLKFDRDEYLALTKWWIGVPLYTEEGAVCPEGSCGSEMDVKGDHSVTCKYGPSRIARHDAVNQAWAFALKGAGLSVKMEVFTDPGTMRRSADTLVDRWQYGRSAAHDWVVSHALQRTALEAGRGKNPDFALEQAERKKDSYAKRRCEGRGLDFVPMAMDTFGGVGVRARKAIDIAVAHARIHHGNALYDRTLSRRSLLQRLQVAVMRGVARQLLRRLVGGEEVVESGVD